MKTLLLCTVCVFAFGTLAASAADPKVDQAIRVYGQVGYNPAKLRTFCAMSEVQESQGENPTEAQEAQLEPYLDQLGEDFDDAWDTTEETDENSADGKRLAAALEQLEAKCDADDGADDGDDDGADDGEDDGADAGDAAEDAADAADTANTVIDLLGN